MKISRQAGGMHEVRKYVGRLPTAAGAIEQLQHADVRLEAIEVEFDRMARRECLG